MFKSYNMDVYPRTLFVAIGESDDTLKEYFKNDPDGIPEMDKNSNAYTLSVTDGKNGGVLVRFESKDVVTQGIVAHECFHAVLIICDYLEINFDTKNDEHVAYMVQWCVNKCFETLWQMKDK